jgi:hypothetical protein
MCVVLETESDEQLERLEDRKNLLHRILPSPGDSSYQLLRYIDSYGDTSFNRLQIAPLLQEIEQLSSSALSVEEKQLISDIKRLPRHCQIGPHLYLKFYGD